MADDNHKHKMMIEIDHDTYNRLKATAAHYHASMRGTVVRYLKDGLNRDPFQTPKAAGDGR